MSTTIALFGELTFDTKQMEFEACCTSRKSIEKVKAECPIIDPDNFDWSTVDIDTWFMCFEEKIVIVIIFQFVNQRIVIMIMRV